MKDYVPIPIFLGIMLLFFLVCNHEFLKLKTEIVTIKTVLLVKGIMPSELCEKGDK